MSSTSDILSSMIPVVDAFEELGVAYYIGGSVASLAHGMYRTTADVDLIADLRMEHVRPLKRLLQSMYYIDEDMIRDAIRHRSEFNLLGVLKVQGTNLDIGYLQRWASSLRVADLLERALMDAGLKEQQ